MHKEGDEVHIDEDDARGGSTPHIVRYVLGISLALAIVALSAIWITGALSSPNAEEEEAVGGIAQGADPATDSDGMNSADDFVFESEPAEAGEGDEATRTVPNPADE